MSDSQRTIRDIAIIRAGDKGDNLHLAVVCNDEAAYDYLWAELTPERLHRYLGTDYSGEVERYQVPNVLGIILVIHDCLGGGLAREWQFERRFLVGTRIMDMELDRAV